MVSIDLIQYLFFTATKHVNSAGWKYLYLVGFQVYGMLSYSVVDFLLCALTVVLVVMILSACVGGVIETRLQLRSSTLLVLGISLTIVSAAKFFAWIFELYWLRSLGNMAR